MSARTSDQLPCVHRLEHIHIDIKRLQAETLKLARESNWPINFMQYDPDVAPQIVRRRSVKEILRDFQICWGQYNHTHSTWFKLRNSTRRALNPEHHEYNYHEPTAEFRGTYFEQVVNQFRSPAIRVRLVKVYPPQLLPQHVDFDTTYGIRVIIPIFADESARNYVWQQGQERAYHLRADGSAYFLNIGRPHAVTTTGTAPRIVMFLTLTNQQDLAEIPLGHTQSNVPETPDPAYHTINGITHVNDGDWEPYQQQHSQDKY